MDHLGTASSILSVIAAIKTLCSYVKHWIHLGEHIRQLYVELQAFEVLVVGLRRAVPWQTATNFPGQEEACEVLAEAEQVLKSLKATVEQAMYGGSWNAVKVRFMLKESLCRAICDKIHRHAASLTWIMLIAISNQGDRTHSAFLQAASETNASMHKRLSLSEPHRTDPDEEKSDFLGRTGGDGSTLDSEPTSPTLVADSKNLMATNISSLAEETGPELGGTQSWQSVQLPLAGAQAPRGRRRSSASWSVNTKILGKCLLKVSLLRGVAMTRAMPCDKIVDSSSDSITAATSGSVDQLLALFQSGLAIPGERSTDGWTLLMNGTYHGNLDVVRYLLRLKANVDARDRYGRQAVHFALIRSYNVGATEVDRDRCRLFPQWEEAKDEFEFTPIHTAVLGDYAPSDIEKPSLATLVHFVDCLNNLPPGTDWKSYRKEYRARSPLFKQIIDLFLKADGEQRQGRRGSAASTVYLDLLNRPDALQGWTPLHWAAYAGRETALRTLLQNGANPFALTAMGRNALHHAVESMQPAITDLIFDIPRARDGTWFDVNLQDAWGETPLHIAIYRQSVSIVERLLRRGARRDLATEDDKSVALHYAAILSFADCQTELVRLLAADGGAHINMQDDRGRVPLCLMLDNPEAAGALVDAGADLSVLDKNGCSVIHHACAGDFAESLERLLDAPGLPDALPLQLNDDGNTPLLHAIETRSMRAAKIMLKRYGPGRILRRGRSLVHLAVETGDAEFLELCFSQAEFRPGVLTGEGWTTKELAARAGIYNRRIRELILRHEGFGGDAVSPPGPDGNTSH